jgi:hypothetical protein
MLNMETKTKMSPQEVRDKAVKFFGPGGYGLEVGEESGDCVTFSGGGGYVSVTACEEGDRTKVNLIGREWDVPMKEFSGSL